MLLLCKSPFFSPFLYSSFTFSAEAENKAYLLDRESSKISDVDRSFSPSVKMTNYLLIIFVLFLTSKQTYAGGKFNPFLFRFMMQQRQQYQQQQMRQQQQAYTTTTAPTTTTTTTTTPIPTTTTTSTTTTSTANATTESTDVTTESPLKMIMPNLEPQMG